jgi:hypothetical protein
MKDQVYGFKRIAEHLPRIEGASMLISKTTKSSTISPDRVTGTLTDTRGTTGVCMQSTVPGHCLCFFGDCRVIPRVAWTPFPVAGFRRTFPIPGGVSKHSETSSTTMRGWITEG